MDEIMINCLKGAIKEVQIGVDEILDSECCDNADESFWELLEAAFNYAREGGKISDLLFDIREWEEYEDYQSFLLVLIKTSVKKGFQIGFNIKPCFNIIQIRDLNNESIAN